MLDAQVEPVDVELPLKGSPDQIVAESGNLEGWLLHRSSMLELPAFESFIIGAPLLDGAYCHANKLYAVVAPVLP